MLLQSLGPLGVSCTRAMPLLNDLLSDELGLSIGSIEEFTPFTLDVTPLQKAFATLSKQVCPQQFW